MRLQGASMNERMSSTRRHIASYISLVAMFTVGLVSLPVVGCGCKPKSTRTTPETAVAIDELQAQLKVVKASQFELDRNCRAPGLEHAIAILRSSSDGIIEPPRLTYAIFGTVHGRIVLLLCWLETGNRASRIRFENDQGVAAEVPIGIDLESPAFKGTCARQPVYHVLPTGAAKSDGSDTLYLPASLFSGSIKVFIVYDNHSLTAPIAACMAPQVPALWRTSASKAGGFPATTRASR